MITSVFAKAGALIGMTVGVALAFSALTGCASQQSGAATPANLPGNCKSYGPRCKGLGACKASCGPCNSCKSACGSCKHY